MNLSAKIPASLATTASLNSMFGRIVALVMTLAFYVGIGLAVWGAVMFALAIKNEEADSKQRALMCLVAGVGLIAIRSIVGALFNIK